MKNFFNSLLIGIDIQGPLFSLKVHFYYILRNTFQKLVLQKYILCRDIRDSTFKLDIVFESEKANQSFRNKKKMLKFDYFGKKGP